MDEFKDQIKDLYKAFSDKQKNTKGTPHKFDSIGNFLEESSELMTLVFH